ncbi:hypothetical protein JCM19239_3445 [Vibrio variabilis]|uniref:Uncharacterized protein n=1 Tax=Vibrio variabilis TaxID=990271 RepID=A0ABQ0JGU1_9VIBR|nr:hypothetical protein JCM19239_3445 [Vibrio variabilis]
MYIFHYQTCLTFEADPNLDDEFIKQTDVVMGDAQPLASQHQQ